MAGPTTIPRGNVLNTLIMQVTLTPVAVGATTCAEQSFTIPGLIAGDQVSGLQLTTAFPNNLVQIENMRVPANNTLTVAYNNGTAGALTPPAGVYLLEINRLENQPAPSAIT